MKKDQIISRDESNDLDHFVPQTYLKQWICSEHQRLHVFNKDTQKTFMPMPKGICAERGGSTNEFLDNPRQIEEFLEGFESAYPPALDSVKNGQYDETSILCISKFIAAVNVCSPTARRTQIPFLEKILETSAKGYDHHKDFQRPPGKKISDYIDSGTMRVDVHERYPESIAVGILDEVVSELTNSKWELLINRKNEPFITSDFPVAIGKHSSDPRFNSKLFPLSPHLAVKIEPDMKSEMETKPLKYFSIQRKEITTSELLNLNQKIARCAEAMVIYTSHAPKFLEFLKRNSSYHIEQKVIEIPQRRGAILFSKYQIAKKVNLDCKKNSNIPEGRWFNLVVNES